MKSDMEQAVPTDNSVSTPSGKGTSTRANVKSKPRLKPGLVALATICRISAKGYTSVKLQGDDTAIEALSSQAYARDDIGKTVACISVHGSDQIMIVGVVQSAKGAQEKHDSVLGRLIDDYQEQDTPNDDIEIFDSLPTAQPTTQLTNSNDPENELVFEAGRSLTFKCGESSISLTADGRVNIRGKFVNNSATQLNRISGGSVKIN